MLGGGAPKTFHNDSHKSLRIGTLHQSLEAVYEAKPSGSKDFGNTYCLPSAFKTLMKTYAVHQRLQQHQQQEKQQPSTTHYETIPNGVSEASKFEWNM